MKSYRLVLALALATALNAADRKPLDIGWTKQTIPQFTKGPVFLGLPMLARVKYLQRLEQTFSTLSLGEMAAILSEDIPVTDQTTYLMWAEKSPRSTAWTRNGSRYLYSESESGVAVVMTIDRIDGRLAVFVSVQNDSAENRVEVDPKGASMYTIGADLRQLEPVPAEAIARGVMKSARIRSAIRGMGSGMATTTSRSTTTGRAGGALDGVDYEETTTTTSPDYEAQRAARRRSQRDMQGAAALGEEALSRALKQNTLFPGTSTAGYIEFEKPKKNADTAIFQIVVGNESFEFPIELRTSR